MAHCQGVGNTLSLLARAPDPVQTPNTAEIKSGGSVTAELSHHTPLQTHVEAAVFGV